MAEDGGRTGGSGSGNGNGDSRRSLRNFVVAGLGLLGGAILFRRFSKSSARSDHTHEVAYALSGEKFSSEQAIQDPQTFFNIRYHGCPAAEIADGSKVLYVEQAFWRTPEKPYRQRFIKLKPCSKELTCDVEVSAFAVRDTEEYRNFCDRPKDQRPQEITGDITKHLTTVHLSRCEKGEPCAYKGSTPPGGFPNSWNGASSCTSELTIFSNGEIHCWDRGYDAEGVQVWGVEKGPYEFKPVG